MRSSRLWDFLCPCVAPCPAHDLKFGIPNFTGGISKCSEFSVPFKLHNLVHHCKERSKHGNSACLRTYSSCLSCGAHTSNYFPVRGRLEAGGLTGLLNQMCLKLRYGLCSVRLVTWLFSRTVPTGCPTKCADHYVPGLE
jgi:hypothetical protein